jgi:hypothetical protein
MFLERPDKMEGVPWFHYSGLLREKKGINPLLPSFWKEPQRLHCMNWAISLTFFTAKIINV